MRSTPPNDYAIRALRNYARNQDKRGRMVFTSEEEMLNWNTCVKSFLAFTEEQQAMLMACYASGDTFGDSIYEVSRDHDIPQNVLWALNNRMIVLWKQNRGMEE